jgi:DNA polymerase
MTESQNPVTALFEMTRKALQQKLELGEAEIMIPRENLERMPEPVKDYENLEEFENDINECTKCPLHKGRTKFVFGVGNPDANIIFVGEGPGREEDLQGEPFVGRAGKLLDKILAAINFERSEVYIANIVKCRPPNNRDPEPSEMQTCLPYLLKQIEMINPRFICCLGRIAAQALLDTRLPLGKLRGDFHDWNDRKVMVTYHPAALLRFPQYKRETWADVQMLRKAYDEFKASS